MHTIKNLSKNTTDGKMPARTIHAFDKVQTIMQDNKSVFSINANCKVTNFLTTVIRNAYN